MKYGIIVAAFGLALIGGNAMAQTTEQITTTTETTPPGAPAPLAPPAPGTLATTSYSKKTDAYGDQSIKQSSTYRDTNGVAQDSQTTTTTVPPPPPVTTTTSTATTTTTGVPQ